MEGAQQLKVIILGVLRERDYAEITAPIDDESYEVWCLNASYEPRRWSRWFQLHGTGWMYFAHGVEYLKWLRGLCVRRPDDVYVFPEEQPFFPCSTAFPEEDVRRINHDYFTHSFAWLTAYATLLGATEIRYDSIDMLVAERFGLPCLEYHIGRAESRGIHIFVDDKNAGIFDNRGGLYGLQKWGNDALPDHIAGLFGYKMNP